MLSIYDQSSMYLSILHLNKLKKNTNHNKRSLKIKDIYDVNMCVL